MEHHIKDMVRQQTVINENKRKLRDRALVMIRSIDQRLDVFREHLDENMRRKPSSWLATKIFNGRLTFEQLQAQRRQLDEDILQATKHRAEFEEPAINKMIKSFEREIQNLQSQIDHQEPNLAELRRQIPNLEQISRVLNPPI